MLKQDLQLSRTAHYRDDQYVRGYPAISDDVGVNRPETCRESSRPSQWWPIPGVRPSV